MGGGGLAMQGPRSAQRMQERLRQEAAVGGMVECGCCRAWREEGELLVEFNDHNDYPRFCVDCIRYMAKLAGLEVVGP